MKEPKEQDLYRLLDVAQNASQAQLRKSFNKLALKIHPDKVTPAKKISATQNFQKTRNAYETLSDDRLRAEYNVRYPAIKAAWEKYDRHQKKSQAKKERRTRSSEKMVKLLTANRTFLAPATMLSTRCAYFKKKLDRAAPWDENDTTVLDLSEDDGEVIHTYVDFLCNARINLDLTEVLAAAKLSKDDSALPKAQHTFLAKLYCFGEKVQNPQFCNSVIDKITLVIDTPILKRRTHTYPNSKVVKIIYDGTPVGSPARGMMVDLYVDNANVSWFPAQSYDCFHPEFTYDFLRAMVQKRALPIWNSPVHEHRHKWYKWK